MNLTSIVTVASLEAELASFRLAAATPSLPPLVIPPPLPIRRSTHDSFPLSARSRSDSPAPHPLYPLPQASFTYDQSPLNQSYGFVSGDSSRRASPGSFDSSDDNRYAPRPKLFTQHQPPHFASGQDYQSRTTTSFLMNQNHLHHEHHRQPPSASSSSSYVSLDCSLVAPQSLI